MLVDASLVDENVTDDMIPRTMAGRMVVGSPEQIAEQIKTKVLDAGIDGVIINMPASTYPARSPRSARRCALVVGLN